MSTGTQFSTSYNEIQDRIQLRARFDDAVELQLLLTRRFTRILFEAGIENGGFSSCYVASRPHPELGDGPLLVACFALRPKSATTGPTGQA